MSLPIPLPYSGEMLKSVIARMMRYYNMSYYTMARLMGIKCKKYRGALSPELIRFFHRSLEGNVSIRQLLLQNSVLPLLTMFGAAELCPATGKTGDEADLLCDLKYGSRALSLKSELCYCPQCFAEQISLYGENYWLLEWQIPKVQVCAIHGCPLMMTSLSNRASYRLSDASMGPKYAVGEEEPDKHAGVLAAAVHYAFAQNELIFHPSNEWDWYFRHLAAARELGLNRFRGTSWYGIEGISRRASDYWGEQWLATHCHSFIKDDLINNLRVGWLKVIVILKAIAPELDLPSAEKELTALKGTYVI